MPQHFSRLFSLIAALGLAGCASYSPQRATEAARAQARPGVGAAADIDASTGRQKLLAAPLDSAAAVALALAYNPDLRITWSRLGIGAAEAFEASRLSNPRLGTARLSGHEGVTRSRSLGLDLADLLLLPQRSRLAARDFEALQLEVAARVVETARDVEAAWFTHQANVQLAQLAKASAEGAAASAELAERFHAAGNISRLQLVRERAAAGEARIEAARARAASVASRAALNALMGLGGEDARRWRVPASLPLPAGDEPALAPLLLAAREHRLDLAAARLQLQILSDGARSARRWRWLGSFELDYEWERETDGSRLRGPALSLELPIFQQGQAATLRADARLLRGQAEADERALSVELGVIEAHTRLLAQREIVATYAGVVVPDRAEAVSRELERYNFMLIGAFELLASKHEEFEAYARWIEAVRDYWLARTDLAHATGRPLPASPDAARTPALDQVIRPQGGNHGGMHDMHGKPPAATGDRDPHAAHRQQQAAAPAANPKPAQHSERHLPAKQASEPAPADPHRQHHAPSASQAQQGDQP